MDQSDDNDDIEPEVHGDDFGELDEEQDGMFDVWSSVLISIKDPTRVMKMRRIRKIEYLLGIYY